MSIFKGTISPEVAWQLAARKHIIQQTSRDGVFSSYTTGKNSWVRMASFVNADVPLRNSKGQIIDPSKKRYDGDELARKYVLEGGTLYEQNNQFFLRKGVLGDGAVYGSDIDKLFSQYQTYTVNYAGQKNINTQDIYSDRPFGMRPMPGISNVQIINKSAYGSLREATIKYYCWDKHQLEELELLYMRVGYSVLLEWGWSQYLDYPVNSLPSTNLNSIDFNKANVPITISNFPQGGFIDPFKKSYTNTAGKTISTTDEIIYQLIDQKVDSRRCNYDAMLGIVKNFSWQLMPNGGYECTTILISRAEILSSLRLSNNGNDQTTVSVVGSDEEPPLTIFEKIFYNLSAYINNRELSEALGSFLPPTGGGGGGGVPPPPPPGFKTEQVIQATANAVIVKVFDAIRNGSNLTLYRDAFGDSYKSYITKSGSPEIGVFNYIQGASTEGVGNEYISLNLFIYILNVFFSLKSETVDPSLRPDDIFVKILLPQKTPCLASRNSVSIDPTTCLIINPKATLVTGKTEGFIPKLFYNDGTDATKEIKEFLMSDGRGDIGAILVSIDKLTTLFNSTSQGPDGVIMVDFIQQLLDDISAALGGINDFKIFVDKDKAQIFDAKYLEQDSETSRDKKYLIDLFGLKSICRDVRISSRIFEEQSTMIAIGAQGQGNIGDIYSSTYNYLNQGLSDRLHPQKPYTALDAKKYALSIYPDLRTLASYINNKCIGDINNDLAGLGKPHVLALNSEEIPTAASIYKTFQLRIAGEDIDYKDLIPFELEITLDGIAGFIQGQIFRVDNRMLPRDYINKNVGLVITGINHTLQNNDWVTTLKTQMCLLDQEALAAQNPNKDLQSTIEKQIAALQKLDKKNAIIWSAYSDYLTYLTISAMKFAMGSDNTVITTGDYVATTNSGLNTSQTDMADFTKWDGGIGAFISGDPNSSQNAKPKYYTFSDYYKKRWLPHIQSLPAGTIDPETIANLPNPNDVGVTSGTTYSGFKYKYLDVNNNEKEGTCYLDLNRIVANGGNGPDVPTLTSDPNSNYTSVTSAYSANPGGSFPVQNVRPTFLTRRNTGRYIFKDFASKAKDGVVIVPIASGGGGGSYFDFEVFDHFLVKPDGSGKFTFDTGFITNDTTNKLIYLDVNKIVGYSKAYVQGLGRGRGTSNTTLLDPQINPQNSSFMAYRVELELSKKIIEPIINPSGDKPVILIKKY